MAIRIMIAGRSGHRPPEEDYEDPNAIDKAGGENHTEAAQWLPWQNHQEQAWLDHQPYDIPHAKGVYGGHRGASQN